MEFKMLELEDQIWMKNAFAEDGKKACEFSFANNLLWSRVYHVQVAKSFGCAVMRYDEGDHIAYVFPVGAGDKRAALQEMLEHTSQDHQKLELTGLVKKETEWVEEWFPGRFEICTDRDDYDYIYNTSDLTQLSGKKYHGKRNHIARFKDKDWSYERITEDNVKECQKMLEKWKVMRADKWDELMEAEYGVVEDALKLYRELDLIGGLIRQCGEVVGFCLGEQQTSDVFVVHFEKAFPEIQGAYPMINQQFVSHECQKYTYINREEDDGEEGLRKAKLSYAPVLLLEKYQAHQKME